jgi:hypothetical protein
LSYCLDFCHFVDLFKSDFIFGHQNVEAKECALDLAHWHYNFIFDTGTVFYRFLTDTMVPLIGPVVTAAEIPNTIPQTFDETLPEEPSLPDIIADLMQFKTDLHV